MSTRPQSRRGRQVTVKRSSATTLYWIIGALVLVGSAVLVFFAARGSFSGDSVSEDVKTYNAEKGTLSAPLTYTNAQGQEISVAEGMHYIGSPEAPVKVIEYADFQCPACATFTNTMEENLFKNYVETGRVQFIYHEFPLTQHANAQNAAQAARCAGDQGKFWEMHDVLFKRQIQWADDGNPTSRFVTYATGLGLDGNAFQSCMNDGKFQPQVEAALQAAGIAQIPATPTFVVNGQQVPTNGLTAAIDAALRGNQ